MPATDCIEALGDWQGCVVGTVERFAKGVKGSRPEIWLELMPDAKSPRFCSSCGKQAEKVHDTSERWVRDLPAWGAQTHLLVHRCRLQCPDCGVKLERLDWLEPYARVTTRLAESVARLCEVLPVKHVAEFYGLKWNTVKRIHKQWLRREFSDLDFSDVRVIGMDEFAIRKGHRYATIFVDLETSRVLWVVKGRSAENIRPFFRDILGENGCAQIQAAVMDMWEPYEQEVRHWCPQAEIVYDFYHIVSKYGREVIDRVRIAEVKKVEQDKSSRSIIKGSKWLLLRNRENIKCQADRVKLKELLALNRSLFTVHVLNEDLKHLWDYRYEGAAENFWRSWYSRAIRSRIEPLKAFARKLKDRLHGILSHCRYPLNTGVLEGINNKIKVIKRMAYGFRDDEYFFLRILSAFPGI